MKEIMAEEGEPTGMDVIPEETLSEETTSLADSIVAGYFNMANSGTFRNRNAELVAWMHECFPRDPSTGMVSSDAICSKYKDLKDINPYAVQPAIQQINEAWAALMDQFQLEQKTGEMMAMAVKQATEMKAKVAKEHWPACDKWMESKHNDMREHMLKKANQALSAMDSATIEVLRLWVQVDLETGLCKSFASMSLDSESPPQDLYFRS